MLIILAISILLIITFLGWGHLVEIFLGKNISGISGKIITGIFSLSCIYTILAFFIPLNIYIEIPTIIIGFIFSILKTNLSDFNSFSRKNYLLLSFITLCILFCGAFNPFILDHFGYYIPSIKWLTEYGLVKGISNLDLILGQMSVWHILQAGFSNFSDPFFKLNTVLLIVYALYTIENKSWAQLILLPILLIFTQSPSPDLPVIVFSLIILNEIFLKNNNLSFLFAFSIFTFSIKPTVIWLPIFVFLYILLISKNNYKSFFSGAVIFLIFILKNIWTFGYPIFPINFLDLGLHWSPNPEILKKSSEFALVKTFDEQYTYNEIINFSNQEKIINWLFLNGVKSYIHILFLISLLFFIFYSVRKKKKIISLICISIVVKSILILLFSAQYRFFIDVFFVIAFVILYNQISQKTSITIISISLSIVMMLFCFPKFIRDYSPSFQLGKFMAKFNEKQIISPTNYDYKEFTSHQIGDLKFNISKNYSFNFNTPLPAISESFVVDYYQAKIFPQPVDKNNLGKGFIWKYLDEVERKKLDTTVRNIQKRYR